MTEPRRRETPSDRARVGTVVAGSYRIDQFLGRGAIGAVFAATHLRLDRPVAVKFVDPTLVDEPEIRARFKREAKIAARIQSSHAVEVFDYGVGEDGAPYLVMERLVGEDLHQKLVRDGPLSVERALRVGKQVCRALGAAHENGIVHRDLKPENVFVVDRDGEPDFVKVVDFGLSTFVQSDDTRLTRAGQSVGTPLYMAPEQAGAAAIDARVDVYSLGVLIFEMTTGRLPFEAATLQALIVQLSSGTPRNPRYYDKALPEELDALVMRFIARDPARRPASAAAALAEILVLEERLGLDPGRTTLPHASSSGRQRAVDGLQGPLPPAFAAAVDEHVESMRRTGRLSTTMDLPPTERAPEPLRAAAAAPAPAPAPSRAALEAQITPVPASSSQYSRLIDRGELEQYLSPGRIEAARPPTSARAEAAPSSPTGPLATPRAQAGPPRPLLITAIVLFVVAALLVVLRLRHG